MWCGGGSAGGEGGTRAAKAKTKRAGDAREGRKGREFASPRVRVRAGSSWLRCARPRGWVLRPAARERAGPVRGAYCTYVCTCTVARAGPAVRCAAFGVLPLRGRPG